MQQPVTLGYCLDWHRLVATIKGTAAMSAILFPEIWRFNDHHSDFIELDSVFFFYIKILGLGSFRPKTLIYRKEENYVPGIVVDTLKQN